MIQQSFSLLLIFGLIYSVHSYEVCDSPAGKLEKLVISSCPNLNKRCELKRGTNVKMSMEITPNEEITNATAVVHGIILNIPAPYSIANPHACIDSGLTCPLSAGVSYTYEATMPVKKSFPRVTVDVKWELTDQNGKNIICVLIPSKVI